MQLQFIHDDDDGDDRNDLSYTFIQRIDYDLESEYDDEDELEAQLDEVMSRIERTDLNFDQCVRQLGKTDFNFE